MQQTPTASGIVIIKLASAEGGQVTASGPIGSTVEFTRSTEDPSQTAAKARSASGTTGTEEFAEAAVYDDGQPITDPVAASPVVQAMAIGMSYTDAVANFAALSPDEAPPSKVAAEAAIAPLTPSAALPQAKVQKHAVTPNVWRSGDIYSSGCVRQHGTKVSYDSYGCRVIRWYGLQGSYYYYGVSNKITGRVSDAINRMTGLSHLTSWYSGNAYVDWAPSSTISKGSCSTVQASVGYGPASLSLSDMICPSSLSPIWAYSNLGFGGKWSTARYDGTSSYRDAISTGIIRHTPGKSMVTAGHSWIGWQN